MGIRHWPSPRVASDWVCPWARPRVETTSPWSMNRSAISTATLSNPPGLPRRSSTNTRMPWPAKVFRGPVDLVGGGFLEARELEITDPFGRAHELDARDAFDVDMATNELMASGRAVAALERDLDSGPFRPLKPVGCFIQAEALDRAAIDGDDQLAGLEPGVQRRSAANDADQAKALLVDLQLDPETDEVAVDHGIEVFELVGGQVAREIVKSVAGAAGEFHQDRSRRQADRLLGHFAARERHADGGRTVGDHERRAITLERVAKPCDSIGRGRGCVGLDEDRIAQGDLEIVEAVADQRLERHRIDIARLDAFENLVVKIEGLFVGQPQQDIAKTAVGIAAIELEMDLAEAEPAAEVGTAGPAFHGVMIDLDRRGPVARTLLVRAPAPSLRRDHPAGSTAAARRGVFSSSAAGESAHATG